MKQEVRRRQFRSGSTVNAVSGDSLPTCKPELHHSISNMSRNPLDIFPFLQEHGTDPTIKVFPFCGLLIVANCTLVFYPEAEGPFTVSPTQP